MSAFLDENGKLVAVSANNRLPVEATNKALPVLSNTGTIGALNAYVEIAVQVTSAGTGCAIIYETSCDSVTWVSSAGLSLTNIGYSRASYASATVDQFQFPRRGLYFRARVSTYGSGTVSIIAVLSKTPFVQLGALYIGGSISLEGGGAGTNPIAIGLESRTSSKTSVANSTLVRPIATVDGRLITRLNAIPENEWQYAAASGGITNTSDVVLAVAQGANIKNYLTGLSVANASATASEVVVKDGSTVIWRTYLAANAPIQSIKFVTPLQSTANTALNAACITTGTQTYINAQGYKAP